MSSARAPCWPVLTLVLAVATGMAWADSPALPSAAALAGLWRLEREGAAPASCVFRLQAHLVQDTQRCLAPLLGFVASSWRVQPDGLLLICPGEALPLLFSRQGATRYSARGEAGERLWLERRGD